MTPKIDHKPFLTLSDRLERIAVGRGRVVLIDADLKVVTEHIKWFKSFMEQRKKAAKCIKHRGLNHKPDDQVKPKSLQRREQRRIKVIKGAELGKYS